MACLGVFPWRHTVVGRPGVRALLRRLAIALHRRAAADQVAVAGDVVDAPDRRPVLVLAQRVQREAGLRLRIRPRPCALEQQVMGVGGAARRSCSWHRAKIRRLSRNVRHAPDTVAKLRPRKSRATLIRRHPLFGKNESLHP